MATLQYRGVEFNSDSAVNEISHIVQYRGTTYNTEDVEKAQVAHEGNYRGVNWAE
ncbi:MAG: DUF4278 domain-containing protein [Pontiellaceae bacterium]